MGVIRRPRLLSDNGPCYVSRELADYLETHQLSHTRGAPYHPMTQGKIERYHRSMNNVVKLEKYYSPWKLDRLARSYRRVSIKVGQVLEISMRQAVGDRFLDGRGHGAPEHRNNRATCCQDKARAHVASVTTSARVLCCFPLTQGIDPTCTPSHRRHLTRRGA